MNRPGRRLRTAPVAYRVSPVHPRWISCLILRLRRRPFAVLITTSYVHAQAHQEIRQDGHPVVILAGRNLVEILKKAAGQLLPRSAVSSARGARCRKRLTTNADHNGIRGMPISADRGSGGCPGQR
jgi:hypothetical protein